MSNLDLIREWWRVYWLVLMRRFGPRPNDPDARDLHSLTDELERREIIQDGRNMTREGAEDLAQRCDEVKQRTFWKLTKTS